MTDVLAGTPAPRWARLLVSLSWGLVMISAAWFLWKGDPHLVFWVPILAFLFLQIAAETSCYKNPIAPSPAQVRRRKIAETTWCILSITSALSLLMFLQNSRRFQIWISIVMSIAFGPMVIWKLYSDTMLIAGRFWKPADASSTEAPLPSGLTEETRYISAPWDARGIALLGMLPLIGMLMVPFNSLSLVVLYSIHLGIWKLADFERYSNRKCSTHVKRDKLLRWLAIGALIIFAIWGAHRTFEVLMNRVVEKRKDPAFGMVYFWILAGLGFCLAYIHLAYNYLMIACGWFEKDLVAERTEERTRAIQEPKPTCVDCGLTFRPGRTRCHFCGGPPLSSSISQPDALAPSEEHSSS
jgi:hypothetical protein